MQNLAGFFLLATPKMSDPRFARRVILICRHHQDEGAMGFVVNRPLPQITLAEVYVNMNLPVPEINLPHVFVGGPVEQEAAFFLHSTEYSSPHFMDVDGLARLSRDQQVLFDIAKGRGPLNFRFLLGYAGWAPGQLEEELADDGWLTLPGTDHDLFSAPVDKLWETIAARHGINIELFDEIAGTA